VRGCFVDTGIISLSHLGFLRAGYCIILSCLALGDKVNIESF